MSRPELRDDIERRLARVAEVTGRAPAELLNHAVAALLDDLEDVAAADAALADVAAGRSRRTSLEDLEREFGLARRVG